jgi:Flp pilus assembly pilin Flp
MRTLARILREQRGAETLEWIMIAGLIVALGAAVYGPNGGALKSALRSAVKTTGEKIEVSVSGK